MAQQVAHTEHLLLGAQSACWPLAPRRRRPRSSRAWRVLVAAQALHHRVRMELHLAPHRAVVRALAMPDEHADVRLVALAERRFAIELGDADLAVHQTVAP